MNSKRIPVTYEVAFRESVTDKRGIVYESGKTYRFTTTSLYSHPADVFDHCYNSLHRLFGCIVKGSFVSFLPVVHDPKITKIGGLAVC